MAAKLAWRLISTDSLWVSVIKRKYISQGSVLDWVRSPVKSSKNASIVWKAIVGSVQLIERGLAWQVGDGNQVRVGRDPWVGCSPNFSLSRELVTHLKSEGIFSLNQVADPRTTSLVKQGWLSGTDLHLENRWMDEWNKYVADLSHSSIRISDSADKLRWVHAQTSIYSPKFGYKWLMTQEGWGNPSWWSKSLWKLKSPAKTRLFFWCILHNKVPNWDFLQKRGKQGPSWCSLYKSDEETLQHLFLSCPFNSSLWAESLRLTNIPLRWHGQDLSQAWNSWWQEAPDNKIRAFPLLIAWGTWIARNKIIFN